MTSVYITPTGSGKKDGSSWDNAATLDKMSSMISKAGPDGEVLIRADMGAYHLKAPIILTSGGSAGHEVTIKGVDGAGNAMDAELVGTRAALVTATSSSGEDAIRLMNGASHLEFQNLAFTNVANAFRAGAPISDVTIEHASGSNVGRFFDNTVSGANKTASIDGLTIRDVDVDGFAKGAVRLRYDTHNVVIDGVKGDGKSIDGQFAIGVHLEGTVHDVLISKSEMRNSNDTTNSYWNGDGFATERGTHDIRFVDTIAAGNTDAGYDIKSEHTSFVRALADDNNRNFRFWTATNTMEDSTILDPHHRGGIGSQAQIWVGKGGGVTITNSVISDNSSATAVFSLEQGGGHVVLNHVSIDKNAGAQLARLYNGSTLVDAGGGPVTWSVWTEPSHGAAPVDTTVPAATPDPTHVDGAAQPPPHPEVGIVAGQATAAEGDSGSTAFTFTVTRAGDLSQSGSVDWAVSGSGQKGANAADFSDGVLPGGTVSFRAGEASKVISVAVQGDLVHELAEGFAVTLSNGVDVVIRTATAGAVIGDDDPVPVPATPTLDGSARENQTLVGTAGHDSFFFDSAAQSGDDEIASFGKTDVLVTTRALADGNRDGIIQFGTNHVLNLDKTGDSISLGGIDGKKGLRSLGQDDDGHSVYADASVRPLKAIEGTLQDNSLAGDRGDRTSNAFFFDTGLGLDLGHDKITGFGARDVLVTTTRLDMTDGHVAFGPGGELLLPAGTGSVAIGSETGTVGALEFDGAVNHKGVDYYVYSLLGSSAGIADLHF